MSDCGHGHVHPRPDGSKARCGGPALCSACAHDLVGTDPLTEDDVRRIVREELDRVARTARPHYGMPRP